MAIKKITNSKSSVARLASAFGKWTKRFFMCAGLALALASAIVYFCEKAPASVSAGRKAKWAERAAPSPEEVRKAAELREFRRRLDSRGRVYRAEVAEEKERFEKALEGALRSGAHTAKAGIPAVVDCCTSLKTFYRMGKDKVRGTHEADEMISDVIDRNVTGAMTETTRKAETLLAAHAVCLHGIANRYMAEVRGLLAEAPASVRTDSALLAHLEATHIRAQNKASDTANSVAGAGIGVGLEIAFAKQSVSAVKSGVKALIRVAMKSAAKRAASTAAASGGAAVCDGPLPIGDAVGVVIAIGGGLWTCWDLKKAYTLIREELPATLKKSIDEHTDALRNSVSERAAAAEASLPQVVEIDA